MSNKKGIEPCKTCGSKQLLYRSKDDTILCRRCGTRRKNGVLKAKGQEERK